MLDKLLKEVVMLSFYDCDKNLSEIDFNDVEKKLEVSFPSSFKSHYFKWNGGDPNLSCFVNDNIDYDYIEIRDFIPMKYSKQFEDDPDFTLEGRAINEWKLNELPKTPLLTRGNPIFSALSILCRAYPHTNNFFIIPS